MSLFAPPMPSPTISPPAIARIPALLFRSSSPAFTVVSPVYVFAVVPENRSVPAPFFTTEPLAAVVLLIVPFTSRSNPFAAEPCAMPKLRAPFPRFRLPVKSAPVAPVPFAFSVTSPPSVSVPVPVVTVAPCAVSLAKIKPARVSEKLLRLNFPVLPTSTIAVFAICSFAPSCTVALSLPPVPSPICSVPPAMAFTFADFARMSVPAVTVVLPVYVFAAVPEKVSVPTPFLITEFAVVPFAITPPKRSVLLLAAVVIVRLVPAAVPSVTAPVPRFRSCVVVVPPPAKVKPPLIVTP